MIGLTCHEYVEGRMNRYYSLTPHLFIMAIVNLCSGYELYSNEQKKKSRQPFSAEDSSDRIVVIDGAGEDVNHHSVLEKDVVFGEDL